MILESIFAFSLKDHQFETGFIRVSATRFWLLRNRFFRWFYKVFRGRGNALRKRCVATGLLRNFGVIFGNGTKKASFSTGFIRVWHMAIPHVLKHYRTHDLLMFLRVRKSKIYHIGPPPQFFILHSSFNEGFI